MELEPHDALNVLVIWRGMHMNVKVNPNSKVLEFGEMLRKLTNVQSDTLRLLVPQSKNQSARLVSPFSAEHSNLSLQEAAVLEGKPIRMMGAFDDEVKEVSQSSIKSDSRILGFDEEEKRLKQRMWNSQQASLKLPTGNYIFCDFRTLNLPGIELNPPPSEALRRMHMLACDPGIIAIMNKHRWRVGIMTEMAPEGYVGISPKCILGFNKNHGEEISLRLRTDDLKGFRKYESIKRTLLHELAHMVYSDHDANFHALDKQLNQESASLDWTKSRGHTLSGRKISDYYDEEELHLGGSSSSTGRKLGGATNSLATARVSSVAAAYNRILNSSSEGPNPSNNGHLSDAAVEPDPDEFELNGVDQKITAEPDPDEFELNGDDQNITAEPEPDESGLNGVDQKITAEPDPDEFGLNGVDQKITAEPDPDDDTVMIENYAEPSIEPSAYDSELMAVDTSNRSVVEPDPDEYISSQTTTIKNFIEPDPDESSPIIPSSNISVADEVMIAKPDTDYQRDGLSSELLQRIEEPVAALCSRIQRAIVMLKAEATPMEANSALQMLFKIIRNVIEHPEEMKFRKLRKSNPHIQRNVANYKAAMEFLTTIGFSEDDISDEVGRKETYLVLKRNDPGLLWLAKSSLEVSMA